MRPMRNVTITRIGFCLLMLQSSSAYALSARHHLYNMGRSLVRVVAAPLEGVVVKGPKNIAHTYEYEVWGS
ncbi:MAG: hypothetical protein Q8R76_09605 [Candidatus Omnitrophota bacterium]|nr:hypothetical protein [Candidatus Omnitrophota bacterium]